MSCLGRGLNLILARARILRGSRAPSPIRAGRRRYFHLSFTLGTPSMTLRTARTDMPLVNWFFNLIVLSYSLFVMDQINRWARSLYMP